MARSGFRGSSREGRVGGEEEQPFYISGFGFLGLKFGSVLWCTHGSEGDTKRTLVRRCLLAMVGDIR